MHACEFSRGFRYFVIVACAVIFIGACTPALSDADKCNAVIAWTDMDSLPINVYSPVRGLFSAGGVAAENEFISLLGFDNKSETWVLATEHIGRGYRLVAIRNGARTTSELKDLQDSNDLHWAVLQNGHVYVPSIANGKLVVRVYALDGKLTATRSFTVPGKKITDIGDDPLAITVGTNGWIAAEMNLANGTPAICVFDAENKYKETVGYECIVVQDTSLPAGSQNKSVSFGEYPQFDASGKRIAYLGAYFGDETGTASKFNPLGIGPRIHELETGKDYEVPGFPPADEIKAKYSVTAMETRWSPDGKYLLVRFQRQTGEYRVYCANVEGTPSWKESIPVEVGNDDWQVLDTLPTGLHKAPAKKD